MRQASTGIASPVLGRLAKRPVINNFYVCTSDRNRTEFLETLMGTVRHLGHASFSMRLLNLSSHGGQSTNLFLLQA